MARRIGLTDRIDAAVIITADSPFSIIFMATDRFTPFSSFAPKRWAVITANPAVKPVTKPITRKFIGPVVPTAAKALVPSNRPTMIVSAILYNCCTMFPISNGIEYKKINLNGLPVVISLAALDTCFGAKLKCSAISEPH